MHRFHEVYIGTLNEWNRVIRRGQENSFSLGILINDTNYDVWKQQIRVCKSDLLIWIFDRNKVYKEVFITDN